MPFSYCLLPASNYRIKSLDHKLTSTESIHTTFQDFLPAEAVLDHEGTIESLRETLASRKHHLALLQRTRSQRELIQKKRDAKEAKLRTLDDEVGKVLELTHLSCLMSRFVIWGVNFSDTISRHKEALLAKSLPPPLLSIWDAISIHSTANLRPTVLVQESSSSSVEGEAKLKIPVTEAMSLILSLSDQGEKDDVIAISLFCSRRTIKHVPSHYCTSSIPLKILGELEDEEITTEEVPVFANGQGSETLIYPALQVNDGTLDWLAFFKNVTARVGMLEELDKALDHIKGISLECNVQGNPNYGGREKSVNDQPVTKRMISKVEVITHISQLGVTFNRGVRNFTLVCRINPLGLATFKDMKERERAVSEDAVGHFVAILKRVNEGNAGLVDQLNCLAECIDKFCSAGTEVAAEELYLTVNNE